MAILTLREHLIVDYPGEALPLLQQLATFERIGRLRPGQHRVVRYWRLTNSGTRLILPRGLAGKAQKLLPGSQVRDERLVLRPVHMGFSADLRDYQAALSDAIYQRGGGVMVMPPSAGKTHTALATVDRWQQPALFFVHQLRLHDKTLKDARKLYRLPRGGLGSIADGRTQIGTHFTVATIQTLAKKPRLIKQLAPRIGTVVIDECHHLASSSYQKVISAFPAMYRLGLSATPERDDGLGPIVYATLGLPVRVSRAALADKGVMVDPTIYMVRTHWTPPEDVPFHAAEEERATSGERNVLIFKLVAQARARGLRVLVLVEREIHATLLAQILSKGGVAAHPVYGRLPQPIQDRNFKAMEQGKAVVVATKLANEGLDWPALDCLVLATPGRSPTVLEQRTGRIARTAEGKTFALVYDLVDDGPMYMDQTKARIAKYQEMGYRIRKFRWPAKPDATVPS